MWCKLKRQTVAQQSVFFDVYFKINFPVRLQTVCLLASDKEDLKKKKRKRKLHTCDQHLTYLQ